MDTSTRDKLTRTAKAMGWTVKEELAGTFVRYIKGSREVNVYFNIRGQAIEVHRVSNGLGRSVSGAAKAEKVLVLLTSARWTANLV